ncbi:hypothetical protein C4578_04180 [Candidatus Microgenomates bacterium]|nr:MAG: hypothetical protein C4578_04180 [Candidatus Microgenomates bacterium]
MIKKRLLISLVGFVMIIAAFLSPTFAATPVQAQDLTYEILRGIPVLPHCPKPGGELIVSHDEGFHQIPGNGLLEGSDQVFRVGDRLFVQCYCPPEESGITTGIEAQWIHESYLTPEQEQFVQDLGWIRIEDGTQWGLPAGVYFVNNSFFKCKEEKACPIIDDKIVEKKEEVKERVAERKEELKERLAERKEEIQERINQRLSWQM